MKLVISAIAVIALSAMQAAAQSGHDVPIPTPELTAAATGGNWVFGSDCTSYANVTNSTGFLIQGREEEWGDTVTQQAGTGRVVTKITMIIFALGGDHPVDVQVRFLEGGGGGVAPGALIWESDLFPQMTIFFGGNAYDFVVPNVLVPDTFTWTVTTTNVGGLPDELGLEFYDPPTQGSSENYVWKRVPPGPGGRWDLRDDFEVGAEINYAASLTVACGCPDPCDMNCDDTVNAFDIEPFLGLLFDGDDPCCGVRGDVGSAGDTNGDGAINAFDIEPFLDCLFP